MEIINSKVFLGLEELRKAGVKSLSPAVQLRVIEIDPAAIFRIYMLMPKIPLDPTVLQKALTDPSYIMGTARLSDSFIKEYFKNNQLLMNKWLRYAQTIRKSE